MRDELIGKLLDGSVVEDGEHCLELEWKTAAGERWVSLVMDGTPLGEVRLE